MSKIYYCDKSKIKYDVTSLEKKVPSVLMSKVKRYQAEEDYQRSLIGYYLLTKILKENYQIDIFEETIIENDFGKLDLNKIHFNISHSNNLIVLIISKYECGIDVEEINDKIDIDKMSKRIYSNQEQVDSLNEDKVDFFFKTWTKKEAYFKYLGKGIQIRDFKNDIVSDILNIVKLYDSCNNSYYLTSFVEDDVEYVEIEKL